MLFMFYSLCNIFIFVICDILQLSYRQGQKGIGPPNWLVQVAGIYSNYISYMFHSERRALQKLHEFFQQCHVSFQ